MSRTTVRRSAMGAGVVTVAVGLTMGLAAFSADASTLPQTAAPAVAPAAAVATDAAFVVASRPFTGTKLEYTRRSIPAPVVKVNDTTLRWGSSKVANPGRPGVKLRTWKTRFVNGKVVSSKKISVRVIVKPRAKVIKVGIKGQPASRSYSRLPAGVNAATFARSISWAKSSAAASVRRCESGGNYASQDSPYYGAYQFLTSTWYSNGGGRFASRADRAPKWAQDYVAYRLWSSSGWGPWACKP